MSNEKVVSKHDNMTVVYDGEHYKTVHKDGSVMSRHEDYHNAFASAESTRGYKTPYGSGVTSSKGIYRKKRIF